MALKEINLAIKPGQSLGILGRSGAGKSTLGMLICGLEEPTSGTIKIHGREVNVHQPAVGHQSFTRSDRARVAQMIWQDAIGSINPRLKVNDIIAEPWRIHKLDERDQDTAVIKLLHEVDLHSSLLDRYPHELSGGEAQRVAIARALALSPELLVCDEPASALDIATKVHITELFAHLRKERGMALLLIAHDLTLVRKLTDELLVLEDGQVVETGETKQILAAPQHRALREIVEAEPALTRA